jgi:hypothetical protein
MEQMIDKTLDPMNNWRWENPDAFGNQVDRSNTLTNIPGTVKHTGEPLSWSGRNDLRAKIEPPSCWQYKPGDFLAVRPLNLDKIIDKEGDK